MDFHLQSKSYRILKVLQVAISSRDRTIEKREATCDRQYSNNIRRLVVVDENNKLVGIITEKDIFRQIATSTSMVTEFVGGNYPIEHREVYQRFTDYIFDLLPKL